MRKFHEQQKEVLEKLVEEKKFVFGDDVLEITASDIKEASRNIRAIRPTSIRYSNVQLLTKVYVALGILMMVGAIYYPRISELFEENRSQAMLFMMGALIALIGLLANYFYLLRKRRYLQAAHMLDSIAIKEWAQPITPQDVLEKIRIQTSSDVKSHERLL
jgi:hypothetical protein